MPLALFLIATVAVLRFEKTPPRLPTAWRTMPAPAAAVRDAPDLHAVARVVDGDTVDVDLDGKIERVRVIGINSPETVDPRKPVECFGREASAEAVRLVFEAGGQVRLTIDPTQDDRDRYGRLLRYADLADGTDLGLSMVRGGYAYEYTYKVPYSRKREYDDAERDAREHDRGLWSPDACAGTRSLKVPARRQ